MRKKLGLLLIIGILTLSLSGCTTYVKDKNGNAVKEATTGQTLAENILCKPTNKDVLKTYEKNKLHHNNADSFIKSDLFSEFSKY